MAPEVDMGLNQRKSSIRKKKRKPSPPGEPTQPASEQTVSEIESGCQRGALQRRAVEDCLVEAVDVAGANAQEPVAAKRRLVARSGGQKSTVQRSMIISESLEGGSGLPSPGGGDPASSTLPDCTCSNEPAEREDTASSWSSSETESGSSFTGSDDDSENEANSDASGSGTDGPASPAGPDKTTPKSNIKGELSGMSFEELLQLQRKEGTKIYNQMAYGTKTTSAATEGTKKNPRLNKNRPMEISAKKPAPFLRQVVPVKKKVHRDPRFDDLSGEYKPAIFERTYSFISDLRKKEKEAIEKKLKKVRDPEQKEKLQQFVQRLDHQEKAGLARQKQRERDLEFKQKQREMAKQGKKPFFLKKSEQRTLELADKYKDLKKSGKLESFLSKKRKRNAGKDKRRLPFQKK